MEAGLRSLVTAASVSLAAGAAGAALMVFTGPLGALLVIGSTAVAVGAVLRLPSHWWPSVLLVVTMVAPGQVLPIPGNASQSGAVSPALLTAVLWLASHLLVAGRRSEQAVPRRRPALVVVVVTLLASIAVSTVTSDDLVTSVVWVVNLLALVLVPLFITTARGVSALLRTWIVVVGLLGAYALAEAFLLGDNPLWGWLGGGGERAFVSSRHPLAAAMFFVPGVLLALGAALRHRAQGALLCAALGAAGLAATGSRGALVATGVGVVVLVLSGIDRRRGVPRVRPGVVVLVLLAVVPVTLVGLGQRQDAGEVRGSDDVRRASTETGLALARETGPTGVGPGLANVLKRATPGPGNDEQRSVENAWLELWIATGPAATAALLLLLATASVSGGRRARWAAVSALVALTVDLGTFNALEGARPNSMVLMGMLLAMCVVHPSSSTTGREGGREKGERPAQRPTVGLSDLPAAVGR